MIATAAVVPFAHAPVLAAEVLDALRPRDHGLYVDGTVGGAGPVDPTGGSSPHPAGKAVGVPTPRLPSVDGILLDLGVSSSQLDVAERGFSFTRPGPLDMRMDPTSGRTALDLLRDRSTAELADLLFTLGEERHARKIARAIHDALAARRLATTTDLAGVVAAVIPAREQRMSKI